MFTVYLIDSLGNAFARYQATFENLPQRTNGRYDILVIDDAKGHWLWIGRNGGMLNTPRLDRQVNLSSFAA